MFIVFIRFHGGVFSLSLPSTQHHFSPSHAFHSRKQIMVGINLLMKQCNGTSVETWFRKCQIESLRCHSKFGLHDKFCKLEVVLNQWKRELLIIMRCFWSVRLFSFDCWQDFTQNSQLSGNTLTLFHSYGTFLQEWWNFCIHSCIASKT